MDVDEFGKDAGFLLSPLSLSSNYGPALCHLRADGALLILGKDCSSRFLGGELCGSLKDEGFYEGSILVFFQKPIWSSRRYRYARVFFFR
jgi:hypothetical protein